MASRWQVWQAAEARPFPVASAQSEVLRSSSQRRWPRNGPHALAGSWKQCPPVLNRVTLITPPCSGSVSRDSSGCRATTAICSRVRACGRGSYTG